MFSACPSCLPISVSETQSEIWEESSCKNTPQRPESSTCPEREREKKGFLKNKNGGLSVEANTQSSLSLENFPFVGVLVGCSRASCCFGLNCGTDKGEQWKWRE